ncbi:Dihydroneopterin aldolase-domain-containing protein [Stachybotrys elegans]|uniref:dihydroneopterin aldolase n=1 Tax=Stachybotrys elegans TaxID=80388 RepID=A0A8K0WWU6_9HYPO|nr:Dihydroneopterin aldolase-domain-containing protein [Stachybotrys elegans]
MDKSLSLAPELQSRLGRSPATIRVKNLQVNIKGPADAWNRKGKQQPMLVSAEVSLSKPFISSSSTDAVEGDTVHYGLLSKAILATVDRFNTKGASSRGWENLQGVLDDIWIDLTGLDPFGASEGDGRPASTKPFLTAESLHHLRLTLLLPKASLLGQGISITYASSFNRNSGNLDMDGHSCTLKLHGLRIPTLIGVNDNERTARQVVAADVEVDRLYLGEDIHVGLESVVVKTMNESSFETLEALATTLARDISQHLEGVVPGPKNQQLTISLEKPTAVPLAEVVCVELCVSTLGALK